MAVTNTFLAPDGLRLAYRRSGTGHPLLCLPGGPGRNPDYLGDLGGLGAGRELIVLEPRGVGSSQPPADPGGYRVDRMVDDIEALREHLALDQIALLGHSAGGELAIQYAARYPDRIASLVLLTPAMASLGLDDPPEEEFRALLERRSGEPWYADALAAVDAMEAGDHSPETRLRFQPFLYGRWDAVARAHAAAAERNPEAAAGYYAEGGFDPPATRDQLTKLAAPVLLYAGELDNSPSAGLSAVAVPLFPAGQLAVQPGAGHFPWLDDPGWFTRAVTGFLDPGTLQG